MTAGIAAPGTAHHHEHENEPYVVTNEWNGFASCGIGTLVVQWATCSTIGDPNDDVRHEFQLDAGIETVVVALDWDPVGGFGSDEFSLYIDADGETVADVSGPTPLHVRLDGLSTNGTTLTFRVFAHSTAGFVYQQPFTVYHDHFYHEPAPEGYSPLPHADDREPYVENNEWNGHLACSVATPVARTEPCLFTHPASNGIEVDLSSGIQTVVLAMDWEAVGGVSSPELTIHVARENYEPIAQASGMAPLELRIDELAPAGETLRFAVWPAGDDVAIGFQQPFTVYHEHFYHEPAPEGYSALPDPHEH